jgi:outer membrane lipopolysaccharide assembly protein LptE/RlpB
MECHVPARCKEEGLREDDNCSEADGRTDVEGSLMDLRDTLQDGLREQGIEGIVTHYVLTVAVTGVDDKEQIINITSDGVGAAMHLGLTAAAQLTAEQRYYSFDDEEEDDE